MGALGSAEAAEGRQVVSPGMYSEENQQALLMGRVGAGSNDTNQDDS